MQEALNGDGCPGVADTSRRQNAVQLSPWCLCCHIIRVCVRAALLSERRTKRREEKRLKILFPRLVNSHGPCKGVNQQARWVRGSLRLQKLEFWETVKEKLRRNVDLVKWIHHLEDFKRTKIKTFYMFCFSFRGNCNEVHSRLTSFVAYFTGFSIFCTGCSFHMYNSVHSLER